MSKALCEPAKVTKAKRYNLIRFKSVAYILRKKSLASVLRLWLSSTNQCHKNVSVFNNCAHALTA